MAKRILAISFWILLSHLTAAYGQNFDRLLPPRDYHTLRADAYRAGARDAYRDADYQGLRQQVVRRYGTEPVDAAPLPRETWRPPVYREEAQYERPSLNDSRYDRPLPADVYRERARWEQRYRETDRCPGPGCRDHDHRDYDRDYNRDVYPDYRPIGYEPERWEWEQARWDHAQRLARVNDNYQAPPAAGVCSSNAANLDRHGNYISDNIYGDPRVFNQDQPVRNILRFMFP